MGKLIFLLYDCQEKKQYFIDVEKFTMIKAVTYKRANVLFSMGNSFLDGNLTFDEIKLSDTLKAVIRFNYGSLWYKFYSSEDFDKKKRELDKIVVSFIERKVSKSFQGMSLDVLLNNKNYSRVLEDGIILVVSRFSNKKKVNVILDFFRKTCSLDYYWSCRDQEFVIKEIVTNIIRSSLNKDIQFDEEIIVRDITVDMEFEDAFPRLDILSDIVMNDEVLGKGFSLCERYVPRSLKSKYMLYMDVKLQARSREMHEQQVVLVFIKHKNLLIRINELQDIFLISEIKRRLYLLMKGYKEKESEIAFIYDSLLGYPSDEIVGYPGEKLVEIKSLRREVPELFVAGYSRECSVKPFIVSEEKAVELEKEGRKTIRYPKKGSYSRIYACPVGYYPGLKRNRLPNKKIFKYLPACYITDHSLNPSSNYSRYYFGNPQYEVGAEARMIEYQSGLYDEYGTVPEMLKKVLMGGSSGREIFKVGSPKSKSSCLYCIHNYMGENFSESVIVDIRKNLTFNPCVCLQELWYMDLSEILSTARDPDHFLDPTLYVRALESVYRLNIYVFDVTKKHDVRLSIAKCPLPYIWEPIQGESIVILCYRDMFEFPHCECIRLDGTQSMRLRDYKSEYLALVKGPDLRKPFTLFEKYCSQALFQQINEDGKCVGILKDGIMEPCFWRPLDICLGEPSEGYLKIKKNIQAREMAYFLCDIVCILKSFCQDSVIDYLEISQEETFFEPFVIRERFESEYDFSVTIL
jgi:hypothetical protein